MADIITDGLKHDGGKPRLDLVPPELIEAVGTVMTHGAEKYGEASYRQVEPQRYRSALMRHICKWLKEPHGNDEDSGLPHLWHIACNVAFLLELDKEEKPKERMLKIVRVKFGARADRTYDYKYISKEPIDVGDIVLVYANGRKATVEVVEVFCIKESQAEYDYKSAVKWSEQNEQTNEKTL